MARAYISDAVVEPYIEALFWQELPRALRSWLSVGVPGSKRRILVRREEELAAYRDNPRLPHTLGGDRFADGLAVRIRRVEQARLALPKFALGRTRPRYPTPTNSRYVGRRCPSKTAVSRSLKCSRACTYRKAGRRSKTACSCAGVAVPPDP